MNTAGANVTTDSSKPAPRVLFVVLFGALIFGTLSIGMLLHSRGSREGAPRDLREITRVPDFALVERSGAILKREDLLGKVWVANFIFTHCSSTCPLMSSRMALLQESLPADKNLRLVSFSVDPKRDTVERLGVYAEAYRANPEIWYFLTGKEGEVEELAQKGFWLAAGTADEDIAHSTRFVLVDGRGYVRGYYDGIGERTLGPLVRDVEKLLKELED